MIIRIILLVITGLCLIGSILDVLLSSRRTSCVFRAGAVVRVAPCLGAPIYYVEEEESRKDIWLSTRKHQPGWVTLVDGGYVQVEQTKMMSIFDVMP